MAKRTPHPGSQAYRTYDGSNRVKVWSKFEEKEFMIKKDFVPTKHPWPWPYWDNYKQKFLLANVVSCMQFCQLSQKTHNRV